MSNKEHKTTQYGAVEILNYLSGQMDRAEMHALELAALDDDLLADAIEGYQLMRETLSDKEILLKLGTIKPSPSKKSAPLKKFTIIRWAGYATAATVIVATGWWLFSLSKPDMILPAHRDSQLQNSTSKSDIPEENISIKPAQIETQEIPSSQDKDLAKVKPTDKSKLLPEHNTPKDILNDELAVVQSKPVEAPASIVSKGNLEKAADNAGALMELQELKQKKTKRMFPANQKDNLKSNWTFQLSDSTLAVPATGMAGYKNFLDTTINRTDNFIPGKAIFSLASDGKIENVQIEGAFSEPERQAIVNLLKNGPTWINKVGKRVETVIQWQ